MHISSVILKSIINPPLSLQIIQQFSYDIIIEFKPKDIIFQISYAIEVVICRYCWRITCMKLSWFFIPSFINRTCSVIVVILLENFIIRCQLTIHPSSCFQWHVANIVVGKIVIGLFKLEIVMTFMIPICNVCSINFLIDLDIRIWIKLKYLKLWVSIWESINDKITKSTKRKIYILTWSLMVK